MNTRHIEQAAGRWDSAPYKAILMELYSRKILYIWRIYPKYELEILFCFRHVCTVAFGHVVILQAFVGAFFDGNGLKVFLE